MELDHGKKRNEGTATGGAARQAAAMGNTNSTDAQQESGDAAEQVSDVEYSDLCFLDKSVLESRLCRFCMPGNADPASAAHVASL